MLKRIYIALSIMVFAIGGHLWDVGSNFANRHGCNGFWCLTTMQLQHLGFYAMYGLFIINTIWLLTILDKKEEGKNGSKFRRNRC